MARKKINVGDWVIAPHGQTYQVIGFERDCEAMAWGMHNGGHHCYHIANLTKLPASPATLAKSHRLLTRWCRADDIEYRYGYPPEWIKARKDAKAHCRRIAKGKGTKK